MAHLELCYETLASQLKLFHPLIDCVGKSGVIYMRAGGN